MKTYNKSIVAAFLLTATFCFFSSGSFGQTEGRLNPEEIVEIYYNEALFVLRNYYGLDIYEIDTSRIQKSTQIFEREKMKLEQLKKDIQLSGSKDSSVIIKTLKTRLHKEFPMLNNENYYSRVNSSLNALYARKRTDG